MPAKGTVPMNPTPFPRLREISRPSLVIIVSAALSVLAAACSSGGPPTPTAGSTGSGDGEVVLVTHDSFALSDEVVASLAADGIELRILASGDAGQALNQSILAGDHPLGDLFFGVDNTLLGRALAADIFEPYRSPRLDSIPEEYRLDPTDRLTPVDRGDVCLNYDISWFNDRALDPPDRLDQLTEPSYRDLLVVENPATSSPGLAFMMATIARFGTEGPYTWLDYWADLRANGVRVDPGWTEAYFTDFTVGGGGDRPLVVSYASSPPAEVVFADPRPDTAPTAVIEDTCFRQIEFAGVLKGAANPAGARRVIDFLLSVPVQEDIPMSMFVFPVIPEAALPSEFVRFAVVPENPLSLPPEEIDANRERWIQEWTDVVLR